MLTATRMHMPPPAPPPPPPRERRGSTTAAAVILAGVAAVGWIASTAVLAVLEMFDVDGQSGPSFLREDHLIATVVALGLLVIAGALVAVPRIRARRNNEQVNWAD